MKLYYAPSTCSLNPHIVLREAGIPFELDRVKFGSPKRTSTGVDFATINPKGSVPALQLDDGEVLTEGAVIVQYLADQRPASNLAPPAGTMERYRLQEWLNYIASELHKGFAPLFNRAATEEAKDVIRKSLTPKFELLARHLAAHPYLMGETFTVADSYLFTILNWKGFVGIDLSPWPVLVAYFETISKRPSVRAAMEAEGLNK
jgi:glutathione S-transferase